MIKSKKIRGILVAVLFFSVIFLQSTFAATPKPNKTASTNGLSKTDTKACKLKIATDRGDVAVGGFPRYEIRMNSIGVINAKVIMVDFPDAPAIKTPQQAFSKISKSSDIFNEVSYGQLKYQLTPVYKWYRMSKPSTSYAPLTKSFEHHQAYIEEAIRLADPDVDFKNTQSFIILANPDAAGIGNAGPAFSPNSLRDGIKVDGNILSNGATSAHDLNDWGHIWLNHEITHTLGMVDLYAFDGFTSDYWSIHRFVGQFSYMGFSSLESNAPNLLAWEKWLLGWVKDNQIYCSNAKSFQQLVTPIESAGGVKAIIIPINKNKVVVIESRRAIGIDKNLQKSGALIYSVDSKIESGFGPIKVYPAIDNDLKKLQSPLAEGQKLAIEGFSIKLVTSNKTGDLISVTKS